MPAIGEKTRPNFWRSIEDLEGDPSFREAVLREFPEGASLLEDPVSRRRFLKVMGASLALAGLNGCTWFPAESVVPYVNAPEEVVPGKPLFYATSFVLGGFAKGVLAETHMARPTKIEGNPDHPGSLGGCDVFMQASLLDLYHPERGKTPTRRGATASWDDFYTHLVLERFAEWDRTRGRGIRLLTGTVTSPTFAELMGEFLARYPEARWIAYEPVSRDRFLGGARLAFGKPVEPVYRLEKAEVVLSLGADFLARGPGDVRYALEFTNGRRLRKQGAGGMNRLYVAETNYSITGAMAEHRIAVKPSHIEALARALASRLGLAPVGTSRPLSADAAAWIEAAAADLLSSRGKGAVLVGEEQPEAVHALGHWINQRLGNAGSTVDYIPTVELSPQGQLHSLAQLADEIKGGHVDSLFMIGADPVYTAPADLGFAELIRKVPHRYCHDVFPTESAFHSDWYLPQVHFLEDWGDSRAFDGTVSLQQPAVAPLYQGKSALELISALLKRPGAPASEILKSRWARNWNELAQAGENFESFWERVLHDGLIRGSALRPVDARLVSDVENRLGRENAESMSEGESLEVGFEPDPRVWDGRFAMNPWLQELPKPLTQLTWDNAAIVSFGTAKKLGLTNEDVVRLELEGRSVEAAVFILPGHADDAVTVHLGYGAVHGAKPETQDDGRGFNAYAIRTSRTHAFGPGLKLSKTNRTYPLASSQHHQDMAGNDLTVLGTFAEYRANPKQIMPDKARVLEREKPLPNLYPDFTYRDEAWAMVIDLSVCIGCKVCTVACQAENNIPVVGKSQVRNKREMHWIRVDRYFHGAPENPGIAFQPVPCMHCEDAPCEYVCPVMATVHDSSGLNQMVYNRCVGTRDCSNNCPYKVRRFNFLQYSEMKDPLKKLVYNPNVTIRERGVMEKCTYCIQRISAARIASGKENRRISAGEVVPACAQACPTRAIVFGDKNNPDEEVTRLKKHPLNYDLLEELGTRPRTSYLARISNPNPKMEPRSL